MIILLLVAVGALCFLAGAFMAACILLPFVDFSLV